MIIIIYDMAVVVNKDMLKYGRMILLIMNKVTEEIKHTYNLHGHHLTIKEVYVFSLCCYLLSKDWVIVGQTLIKFRI